MQGSPFRSQNLISQVAAAPVLRQMGFYKSIGVDFVGVVTALLLSLAYWHYLAHDVSLTVLSLAVAAFMIASIFGALLMQSPARRAFVLFAETVALFTFFFDLPTTTLTSLGALVYFFLLWGDVATHRELVSCVEVKFFRITRPLLRKLATALLLSGIVIYLPQWTVDRSFFPRPAFQAMFASAENVAENFYPEIRFNSTTNDFLSSVAIVKLKTDPTYVVLSPSAQVEPFNRTVLQMYETVTQVLAIDVWPDETLADMLYRFCTTFLDRWQKEFGDHFLAVWAVAAYAVLRVFCAVFDVFVMAAAFLIYQLLLAGNFIIVTGETKIQETLRFT